MTNKPNTPFPEGYSQGQTPKQDIGAPPDIFKVPKSATFKDLVKEFTFFNHLPATILGSFPHDPVRQYYVSENRSDKPALLVFDRQIFAGLEMLGPMLPWNQMLFVVPNEIWKDLANVLGTIAAKNTPTKTYFEAVVQKIPMVDYLELSRHETLPEPDKLDFVDIYTVALDGNKACFHFVPSQHPPVEPIMFRADGPRKEMMDFATALFSGKADLSKRTNL